MATIYKFRNINMEQLLKEFERNFEKGKKEKLKHISNFEKKDIKG